MQWKSAVADGLKPFGLTPTQFFVLGSIGWAARTSDVRPTQGQVAKATGLDPMTTSQVVRALEHAKLVQRLDDPHDTRAWRLALTDQGALTLKRAAKAVRDTEAKFFGRLEGDKEGFVQNLVHLHRR
jgi:DNA-binding MarR family transcriptional regulator